MTQESKYPAYFLSTNVLKNDSSSYDSLSSSDTLTPTQNECSNMMSSVITIAIASVVLILVYALLYCLQHHIPASPRQMTLILPFTLLRVAINAVLWNVLPCLLLPALLFALPRELVPFGEHAACLLLSFTPIGAAIIFTQTLIGTILYNPKRVVRELRDLVTPDFSHIPSGGRVLHVGLFARGALFADVLLRHQRGSLHAAEVIGLEWSVDGEERHAILHNLVAAAHHTSPLYTPSLSLEAAEEKVISATLHRDMTFHTPFPSEHFDWVVVEPFVRGDRPICNLITSEKRMAQRMRAVLAELRRVMVVGGKIIALESPDVSALLYADLRDAGFAELTRFGTEQRLALLPPPFAEKCFVLTARKPHTSASDDAKFGSTDTLDALDTATTHLSDRLYGNGKLPPTHIGLPLRHTILVGIQIIVTVGLVVVGIVLFPHLQAPRSVAENVQFKMFPLAVAMQYTSLAVIHREAHWQSRLNYKSVTQLLRSFLPVELMILFCSVIIGALITLPRTFLQWIFARLHINVPDGVTLTIFIIVLTIFLILLGKGLAHWGKTRAMASRNIAF